MSVLADTNILVRRAQPDHPQHAAAVESIAILLGRADPVYFLMQNIPEFWNVATRALANIGLRFSVAFALGEVKKIERVLTFLPDAHSVYAEWKRLLFKHNILGNQVHDAKLVAAMNVHRIAKILTFNIHDFARYEIEAIHPDSLIL